MPLAMEIPEPGAERGLWRDDGALGVDPGAKLVENGPRMLLTSCSSLIGVVAGERRDALHSEEPADDSKAFERDLVAGARGFDEAPPAVCPTAGPLAAGTLDERRDVGAVALHGAREVLAEKATHALRVAA